MKYNMVMGGGGDTWTAQVFLSSRKTPCNAQSPQQPKNVYH